MPSFKDMHSAGYALGYPYEVRTRTGRLTLIRPLNHEELVSASRFLHYAGPVYSLKLDQSAFEAQGVRRYELQRLEPKDEAVASTL